MRTIIALCFIALFAGAFASHHKKAAVQETKLGAALKGLFQLAQEDEYAEIAEILDEVYEEIEGLLDDTLEEEEEVNGGLEDQISAAEEEVDNLEGELEELATSLEAAEEVADQLREEIDASTEAVNQATAQRDSEVARRTDSHNYQTSVVDALKDAIENAEEALRLLQEIDNEDLEGSFLEINHKKIKTNFAKIHKSLSEFKFKNTVLPMAQMLVEVTSEGINHDLISQIEDLINNFIDVCNNGIDEHVAADNADDEASRTLLDTLANTIQVQSDSASNNQANLNNVEDEITVLTAQAEDLAAVLDNRKENLESLQDQLEASQKRYSGIEKRLRGDLAAIEVAQEFVNRD